jgi:hypothetical protein
MQSRSLDLPFFSQERFGIGGSRNIAERPRFGPAVDQFTHTWKGATWRFASQANLDAFMKAPEMFAPQYGGYCAFAVGYNSFASSSGESSLRASIGEQIAWASRAHGFEVVIGLIGNVDSKTMLWSITIRNTSQVTGPTKLGATGRDHTSSK